MKTASSSALLLGLFFFGQLQATAIEVPGFLEAYKAAERTAQNQARSLEYAKAIATWEAYAKKWSGERKAKHFLNRARKATAHYEMMMQAWARARKSPETSLGDLVKQVLEKPAMGAPKISSEELYACFNFAKKHDKRLQVAADRVFPLRIEGAAGWKILTSNLAEEGKKLGMPFSFEDAPKKNRMRLKPVAEDAQGRIGPYHTPDLQVAKVQTQIQLIDTQNKVFQEFSVSRSGMGKTQEVARASGQKQIAQAIVKKLVTNLLTKVFP